MNKVNGKKASFSPVRNDGTRIAICYGLQNLEGDLYEWYEVYLPKKQTSSLTLSDIKSAIISDINARTDVKILSGFTWNGAPVWLSQENQFNYKAAYDLAVQTDGATLPVTFKMGEQEDGTPVYHTFADMGEATDFYTHVVNHIHQCVTEGWAEKDGIDWTPYEDLYEKID